MEPRVLAAREKYDRKASFVVQNSSWKTKLMSALSLPELTITELEKLQDDSSFTVEASAYLEEKKRPTKSNEGIGVCTCHVMKQCISVWGIGAYLLQFTFGIVRKGGKTPLRQLFKAVERKPESIHDLGRCLLDVVENNMLGC